MDIEIVRTVENNFSRTETVLLKSEIGSRCGRIIIERRNRLGMLVCRCECGETISLSPKKFATGKFHECTSCDKWRKKTPAHKFLGTAIYKNLIQRSKSARDRCNNQNNSSYSRYGERGIQYNFNSAEDYAMCVGVHAITYGLDMDVDRIDNDGHYEPSNIRLATRQDNIRNRSNTIKLNGTPLMAIIEEIGFNPDRDVYLRAKDLIRYNKHRLDDQQLLGDLEAHLIKSGFEKQQECTFT